MKNNIKNLSKLSLNRLSILISCICIAVLLSCCGNKTKPATTVNENFAVNFVDDDGNKIQLEKPCERIISLYSAHIENLYELGAGDKIIGAIKTSIYPPHAISLPRYDYKSDPEEIIAAQPDAVLIRPNIASRHPQFVEALKNTGIPVVSLYPKSFDEFDNYIKRLGMLVGKSDVADEKLIQFHKDIQMVSSQVSNVNDKPKVFFESTETNLRTVTKDSLPGRAIEFAGGINVAQDAQAVNKVSSIASFGTEKVLALANDIDVYVSQRGAMNAGGNEHSISIRPGFDTIKAVKNGKILIINEKIISSPTFRYYKGIRALARFMYPEIMDNMDNFDRNALATKTDFSKIIVKAKHLPIFVPSSSKYYEKAKKGHIYGFFEDVTYKNDSFDFIEAAVHSGAISYEKKDGKEFFEPDKKVTREQLASAVFILNKIAPSKGTVTINDLDKCDNKNIVSAIVESGKMSLENGNFNPTKEVTIGEIIDALSK